MPTADPFALAEMSNKRLRYAAQRSAIVVARVVADVHGVLTTEETEFNLALREECVRRFGQTYDGVNRAWVATSVDDI